MYFQELSCRLSIFLLLFFFLENSSTWEFEEICVVSIWVKTFCFSGESRILQHFCDQKSHSEFFFFFFSLCLNFLFIYLKFFKCLISSWNLPCVVFMQPFLPKKGANNFAFQGWWMLKGFVGNLVFDSRKWSCFWMLMAI